MKTVWTWTPKLVLTLLAFLVGLSWAIEQQIQGKTLSVVTLLPLGIMTAMKIVSFFSNPPQSPDAGFVAGEAQTGAATPLAKKIPPGVQTLFVMAFVVGGLGMAVLPAATVGCGATPAQIATPIIDVANSTCQELIADDNSPTVDFLCTLEGVVGSGVKILTMRVARDKVPAFRLMYVHASDAGADAALSKPSAP
jgi:hypothetical protein